MPTRTYRVLLLVATLTGTGSHIAAESFDPWPAPLVPDHNPMSAAKVVLGQRLFHEPGLSVTGRYSCASCHQPDRHFTDGLKLAVGATGQIHTRHTPTLYNVAFHVSLGWTDDQITTLAQQHRIPLTNTAPIEMGCSDTQLQALEQNAGYRDAFNAAFGAPTVSLERVTQALASFLRTLRAPRSAFDRYVFDDEQGALNQAAKAGMALFFSERTGCSHCHASLNFSGPIQHEHQQTPAVFHVMGVSGSELAFRAPTLRAISHTAPYMHDGSLPDLNSVLKHYQAHPSERVPQFSLSDEEAAQLIAFLATL